MKKFFLFLNLFFPVYYYSHLPHSSMSSRSSISSFRTNTMQQTKIQEAKAEHIMQNTIYANDGGNFENKPHDSISSKKKYCIVIFGIFIVGLLAYNYLNTQTSNSSPIII